MALNIDIYNGSYFLQLDADYGLEFGSRLNLPGERAIFAEPWARGFSPLVGINYANREITFQIQVPGTSLDDWITNNSQLQTLLKQAELYQTSGGLDGDRAYLSIQLSGMTNTTEWEILRGHLDNTEFATARMTRTGAPALFKVPLVLIIKPLGGPQQYIRVTSTTLNNGGGATATNDRYILPAPTGETAAPTRITYKPTAGLAWTRFLLGQKTRGNVNNFIFAYDAENATYAGYQAVKGASANNVDTTNVAVAAAHNGNVLRVVHAFASATNNYPVVTWTIQKNLHDFIGRYRAFLRVDVGLAAATGLQLFYGGSSGDTIALTKVAATFTGNDFLVDMGNVEIPQMPSGDLAFGSFKMMLKASFAATTGNFDVDNLYLLPIDEGLIDVELAALSTTEDTLVVDNLAPFPSLNVTDSSGDLKFSKWAAVNAQSLPFTIPKIDNGWFPLITASSTGSVLANHVLTDQLTIGIDYRPQYELFR